jgi:hypothetical protein
MAADRRDLYPDMAGAADGGRPSLWADLEGAGRPVRGSGTADAARPVPGVDLMDGDHPLPCPDRADAADGGHPLHGFLWEDPAGDDRRFHEEDPMAGGHPRLSPDRADGEGGDPEFLPSAGAADGGHRLHAAAPPKNAGSPDHGGPDRSGRPAAARGRGSPRPRSVPGFLPLLAVVLEADPRGASGRVHRRPGLLRSVVLSSCTSLHTAAPSTRI